MLNRLSIALTLTIALVSCRSMETRTSDLKQNDADPIVLMRLSSLGFSFTTAYLERQLQFEGGDFELRFKVFFNEEKLPYFVYPKENPMIFKFAPDLLSLDDAVFEVPSKYLKDGAFSVRFIVEDEDTASASDVLFESHWATDIANILEEKRVTIEDSRSKISLEFFVLKR